MITTKLDLLEVHLNGKLCLNLYSVAAQDTSCTIRLLAKFEFPAQVLIKLALIVYQWYFISSI